MTTIALPDPTGGTGTPAHGVGDAAGQTATTPRDARRRARILTAATELFAERGYDATGVGDIAATVSMGPATIYRLVGSKQRVLAEVILDSLTAALDGLQSVDVTAQAGLDHLADLAIQHRHLGLLWQRDTRRLTAEVQGTARTLIRQFATVLTSQLGAARPELNRVSTDLLAWAAVAVMVSPSLHHVEAAFDEYRRQIAVILGRILTAPIPGDLPTGAPPDRGETRLLPASRREAIYLTALRLFAERGYADVSVEDIGAAVGASGPSIYHHFPSKQHLLATAAQRASAARQVAVVGAYSSSTDAAGVLDALLTRHLEFALVHHELLSVLTMDVTHLPKADRALAAAAEREHLDEWRHLLRQVRGTGSGIDSGAVGSLIEISCTVDVIDNVARIAHLRTHPGVVASLPTLCRWMLHLRL